MSDVRNEKARIALEESFYREDTAEARAQLRALGQAGASGDSVDAALAEATGIRSRSLLARLVGLGIRPDTLAALTLIPLIEVAWADDVMNERERNAILEGAESTGITPDSPSHTLLRIWTEDRPPPDMVQLWRDYVSSLCLEFQPEEKSRFRENVLGRAYRVAKAAGGVLGIGSVSCEEERVLAELEVAFGV